MSGNAAIVAVGQCYDQQVTDLDTVSGLADGITDREEKLSVVAARLQDVGISGSELANCAGAHPNRLRRLIDRHNVITEG